ncbi:class I SAM-dependent methyltransferase [Rufibacter sediminis]|uniref:Methyltransferase domain-containing protein n=1 Tax=Rufibacter sediminis TaxID=2762756 RepID=A0ABR6VVQ6_9BACT|nr:class I SAM-dependent methyltransferase [Rufibacter sediminis]MBC3541265.1 methyltransferase domain-containing protein [Rufibacter sediminis]
MPVPLLKKVLPAQTRLSLRQFYWLSRSWLYVGNKVYCPLCEAAFRTFLPFGTERRQQALCPRCHTVERHRLLWLYLTEQVNITQRSLEVLHMAPEPILQSRLKRLLHLRYRSADLTSPVAMDHADIQALPYPDATFDLILCSHVLAHVPNDAKALQELRRVLKPTGQLLLQARLHPHAHTVEQPNAITPQQRLQAYGQADRFRNYGQDFGQRVAAQGFSVEKVEYALTRTPEEQTRLGLGNGELIFVATPSRHEAQ